MTTTMMTGSSTPPRPLCSLSSPSSFTSTLSDLRLASSTLSGMHSRRPLWRRAWESNRGILLVLMGEVFRAGMTATTRLLEENEVDGREGMGTLQILFARFSITLVLSSTYMYFAGTADFPWGAKGVRSLLWLRGLFGFVGIYGFYYSLRFLQLAEAVVIGFLAPLLTAYATSMILHTDFSRFQMLAGITAFLGVVIIADPFSLNGRLMFSSPGNNRSSVSSQLPSEITPEVSSFHRLTAVVLGLFSVVGTTGAFTTIRVVGDRVHALILVNYYALATTIVSGLILFLPIPPLPFLGDASFRLPETLREWTLLSYIGICGFMLQFLMTAGLQADNSSRATNMMYIQIIFALCLDWGIWRHVPGWGSAVGGTVVLSAVIWGSLIKEDGILEKQRNEDYVAICTEEDVELLGDDIERQEMRGDSEATLH